jgi:hypothetical protein
MRPHLFDAPIGAAFDVACVLRQRADARNREEPLELLEIAVAIHVDEVDHVVHAFLRSQVSRLEAQR